MPRHCPHIPDRQVAPLALAGLLAVTGCQRADEAGMRTRLEQWFALGDTMHFAARMDCAAGLFRLVDTQISSAMPVSGNVAEMLRALPGRGVAALDNPGQAPDAGMVEAANTERSTGMAMRRAGLEARDCMEGPIEGVFRAALTRPSAVLAYDTGQRTLMLIDGETGFLVVAMGAR